LQVGSFDHLRVTVDNEVAEFGDGRYGTTVEETKGLQAALETVDDRLKKRPPGLTGKMWRMPTYEERKNEEKAEAIRVAALKARLERGAKRSRNRRLGAIGAAALSTVAAVGMMVESLRGGDSEASFGESAGAIADDATELHGSGSDTTQSATDSHERQKLLPEFFDENGSTVQEVDWTSAVTEETDFAKIRYLDQYFENSEVSAENTAANIKIFRLDKDGDTQIGGTLSLVTVNGEKKLLGVGHSFNYDNLQGMYARIAGKGSISLTGQLDTIDRETFATDNNPYDSAVLVSITPEQDEMFEEMIRSGDIVAFSLAEDEVAHGEELIIESGYAGRKMVATYVGPHDESDPDDKYYRRPEAVLHQNNPYTTKATDTAAAVADDIFDEDERAAFADDVAQLPENIRDLVLTDIVCAGNSGSIIRNEDGEAVAVLRAILLRSKKTENRQDFAMPDHPMCAVVAILEPIVPFAPIG